MKAILVLISVIMLLNCCHLWNVEYVAEYLILPLAKVAHETLFCVCSKCFDNSLDTLMKWLQTETMKPQLVVSQHTGLTLKYSNIKRLSLTVILAEEFDDPIFKIHYDMAKGRHFYLNIILILKPVQDFQQIAAMLRYLHEEKFENTNVYYVNASNKRPAIFSFDYYPQFTIVNQTRWVGDERKLFYKAHQKRDLKGYRFTTPLMQDLPKVINYKNKHNNKRCVQGVTFNIMNMMLAHLNGTLSETQLEFTDMTAWVDMKYVLEEVRQEKVDLAAHAYALFQDDDRVQKSYPLLVVNWCLMVPSYDQEITMFYPFYPFKLQVWLMVLLVFVLINIVSYGFAKLHGIEPTNIILINFCKFINAAPPKPSQNPTNLWLDMILNGFIFILSFFLTAFYTSQLGSILTVTVKDKQINSMDDLLEEQLPIMIIDYELEFLFKAGFKLSRKFLKLIRSVNSSIFYQHQLKLNTSYGYFTTYDKWHFLDFQQRHLGLSLFRYSDICFGDYHLAFPMIAESPVWKDVEMLMLYIQSAGLYSYHEQKAFDYAASAGLINSPKEKSSFQTVGFENLYLVLGFLAFGLLLAFFAFLLELWQKRKEIKKINDMQRRHAQA